MKQKIEAKPENKSAQSDMDLTCVAKWSQIHNNELNLC